MYITLYIINIYSYNICDQNFVGIQLHENKLNTYLFSVLIGLHEPPVYVLCAIRLQEAVELKFGLALSPR